MILLKMKETAEAYLGTVVTNAGSFAFLLCRVLLADLGPPAQSSPSRPTSTTRSARPPRTPESSRA